MQNYTSYPEFPWEQELLNSSGDLGTFDADFLKDQISIYKKSNSECQ